MIPTVPSYVDDGTSTTCRQCGRCLRTCDAWGHHGVAYCHPCWCTVDYNLKPPTDEECCEGNARLAVILGGSIFANGLAVRFCPAEGGVANLSELDRVIYAPDPKSGRLFLPRSIAGTHHVRIYDGCWKGDQDAVRFKVGGDFLVRVKISTEPQFPGLRFYLPPDPAERAWIFWYDWSLKETS